MKIPILYEDNHLLVVEKPVNMPVQEDSTADKDLLTLMKEDIKERYDKPGNVYLGLIHRLDRPVGGVIVFAKTSKAASRMSNHLRKQEINRVYFTVVRGIVNEPSGTLKHYLYKDRDKNQVYAVNKDRKDAKEAILNYEVIDRYKNENLTLLKVTLQTGRSHQIRVQLKAMGHPIFGDQKYGAHVNKVGEQIALWASELSFKHPVQDKIVKVASRPPQLFPWNL